MDSVDRGLGDVVSDFVASAAMRLDLGVGDAAETLIAVKLTGAALTPAMIRNPLLQAIGYLLLERDDKHEIRRLSLWFPRYDRSWT